jgi:D-alanyl-D-alanine carboxypeptidase
MNNNPKSNTRQYSTTTYSSRNRRNKKHSQNKLVFFILLALLIIALIVAIVFVVADLVGGSGEETSGDPTGTEAPGFVAEGHSMSCAYDNDDATYMLSVTKQSAGSYFSCEFEAETAVSSVRLVSNEPDYYIRGCEVQLKINGDWISVGIFGSGANEKEYNPSLPFAATAVRIYLSENADTLWAINELSVKDKDGNAVALCKPSMGTNTPGGTESDVTTAPETQQGETTTSPAPETTQKIDQGTTTITVSNDNMYTGDLILVNSNYAFRFPSSQASLLNVYNEYYARDYHCNYFVDSSVQLEAVASHALLEMANALFVEKGINNLQIGTGYRSYETQQDLSTRYPATAALPGYSEHHTGLGIDLQIWDKDKKVTYAFDDTTPLCNTILSWMNANAYKYGFVRRFAPNKDAITQIASDRWHYRYVGVPHAYYMTANDLCLEEYLAALENCTYGGNHLNFEVDGKSYEIYFVPAVAGTTTTIPVPSDPSIYTISGNNYSGFIVTITRG